MLEGMSKRQKTTLALMIFGPFIVMLNQTAVNPALSTIMRDMSIGQSTVQWLSTGFTMANAIMVPLMAALADRFSRRDLFCGAMVVFLTGTLLCALGPVFGLVLAGRVLQGMCSGIVMPLVMAVMMTTFPQHQRGQAMGIYGLAIGFAPVIGPTCAGILIDNLSWRAMFGIVALLALLVIIASYLVLDDSPAAMEGIAIDKPSLLMSCAGFGSLLAGFSTIGTHGAGWEAGALLLVGAVVVSAFIHRQLTLDEPMLRIGILASRQFALGTLLGSITHMALLGMTVLLPIYIQAYRGFSATASGLTLMPGAIIMGVMGVVWGRAYDRHGARGVTIGGYAVLTACTTCMCFLGPSTPLAAVSALYAGRMLGLSMVNSPLMTWGMEGLPDKDMTHASSLTNTFKQLSGALGTAILVSISSFTVSHAPAGTGAAEAGIHGTDIAFAFTAIVCGIALILSIALVRDGARRGKADAGNGDGARPGNGMLPGDGMPSGNGAGCVGDAPSGNGARPGEDAE